MRYKNEEKKETCIIRIYIFFFARAYEEEKRTKEKIEEASNSYLYG
jgi:hypothetical protein